MKIFIDSADIQEIKQALELGLCDGITTNPSLIAKTGKGHAEVIKEVCALTDVPVNAETVGVTYKEIIAEGSELSKIAENVVIKIPINKDGLRAVRYFSEKGIATTVTLIFSVSQALLAAKAGAAFIAPFVGRLDDISRDGMELIEDIVEVYDIYDLETEVIVASVRSPLHFKQAALAGADAITVPFSLIDKLLADPLTDAGIAKFLLDAGKK